MQDRVLSRVVVVLAVMAIPSQAVPQRPTTSSHVHPATYRGKEDAHVFADNQLHVTTELWTKWVSGSARLRMTIQPINNGGVAGIDEFLKERKDFFKRSERCDFGAQLVGPDHFEIAKVFIPMTNEVDSTDDVASTFGTISVKMSEDDYVSFSAGDWRFAWRCW
jgi:hypothetical protein